MAVTDVNPAPAPPTSRRPSLQDLRRRRDTVTVVCAALAFAVLTVVVRIGWAPLQTVDMDVARSLNRLVAPHPALITALNAVTTLGSASILVWLVVLTLIVLLVRQRFRLAAYLAVTTAGAIVLDPMLKALIGRIRPVVPHPIAYGGGSSFPSGHALDSLICYGALALVLLPALRRYRGWLLGVLGTVVFLVGLSRIMLGVHFVSDVLGAWCVGVAWLGLTVWTFEIFRNQAGRRVPQPLTEGVEPEARPDVTLTDSAADDNTGGVPRTIGLLVLGLVFTAGVLIGLGELVMRGGNNILGDHTIPAWLAAHRTPSLNSFSDFWSQAGNTHAIMAVGLVVGAVAIGVIRRWRPVAFLLVAMFGELALFLGAAKVIGRDRPEVPHLDGPLPTSAYPSGHVAATLCLYIAIVLLVVPRTRAWWRWLTLVPAIIMPVAVALSRMYRGMHHPTDVLASCVLAAAWLTIAYIAVRPHADLDPKRAELGRPTPGSAREPVDRRIPVGSGAPVSRTAGGDPTPG